MADFVTTLASRAGIDTGSAMNGLGALLATLQQYVPVETFERIRQSVPDAGAVLERFQSTAAGSAASARSALAGMVSRLAGNASGAITTMMTQLAKGGLSLAMIRRFLPAAASMLRDVVPPGVVAEIERSIPGISSALLRSWNEGMLGGAR